MNRKCINIFCKLHLTNHISIINFKFKRGLSINCFRWKNKSKKQPIVSSLSLSLLTKKFNGGSSKTTTTSSATELPDDFITHLVAGLTDLGILNIFIDRDEWWGRDLIHVFTCIEESTIALAIFSSCYPETEWCLDELVKMKERANEKKLLVIPVFYDVSKNDVRNLEGEFGDRFMETTRKYTNYKYDPFRMKRWETAVTTVLRMKPSVTCEARSSDLILVEDIIKVVKKELDKASASDPGLSHSKTPIGEVFVSAFIAAFLFSLFIARLVFTDVKFFRTAKWLVGFPVTIVLLHQLYCLLAQRRRQSIS